jgi:hypothetical protein
MRKAFIAFMAVAMGFAFVSSSNAAIDNLGRSEAWTFTGHVLTSPEAGPGARVLYAPSESDDPGLRAAIAASLGGGAVVDYYDTRASTPDVAFLNGYDCVFTWANYAYSNNVLFGNNLADFVDDGGTVVLGAFAAYTIGNYLAGRIMDDLAYCPVRGGFNHFTFSSWVGDGATDCVHDGVGFYGSTYRDILVLDGTGAFTIGHFGDGEISVASNSARSVVYANGTGGFPLDGGLPDNDQLVANSCICSGPTATESTTWGAVKDLYR